MLYQMDCAAIEGDAYKEFVVIRKILGIILGEIRKYK
jgi:hypothetical protein